MLCSGHALAKRNRELASARIKRYKAAYTAGCANCSRKNYAEAIVDFERCIALNPNHDLAHHGKGIALQILQLYEEAGNLSSEKCLELDDLAALVTWFMKTLESTGKFLVGKYHFPNLKLCRLFLRKDPSLAQVIATRMDKFEMKLSDISSDVRESHDEVQSSLNWISGELAAARLGPAK
jgi:tetratricopeptide (TPR) repeat protein